MSKAKIFKNNNNNNALQQEQLNLFEFRKALQEGNIHVLRAILQHDPSVINRTSSDNPMTSLGLAIIQHASTDIILLLLRAGADVNIVNLSTLENAFSLARNVNSIEAYNTIEGYSTTQIDSNEVQISQNLDTMNTSNDNPLVEEFKELYLILHGNPSPLHVLNMFKAMHYKEQQNNLYIMLNEKRDKINQIQSKLQYMESKVKKFEKGWENVLDNIIKKLSPKKHFPYWLKKLERDKKKFLEEKAMDNRIHQNIKLVIKKNNKEDESLFLCTDKPPSQINIECKKNNNELKDGQLTPKTLLTLYKSLYHMHNNHLPSNKEIKNFESLSRDEREALVRDLDASYNDFEEIYESGNLESNVNHNNILTNDFCNQHLHTDTIESDNLKKYKKLFEKLYPEEKPDINLFNSLPLEIQAEQIEQLKNQLSLNQPTHEQININVDSTELHNQNALKIVGKIIDDIINSIEYTN